MSVQRKQYSAELKTRVALEAIKGYKTANKIASEYGMLPTQIANWKKQALYGLPDVFSTTRADQKKSEEDLITSYDPRNRAFKNAGGLEGRTYPYQLGWPRESLRQHFCRALVAQREIRGS